jgi:chorismate mutase/prephenate dehydratase
MNRDRQQEIAAESIAALKDAEERVRATDLQMRALFLQRLEALRALARWKKERGLPAEDRELELRTLSELTPGVEEEAQRSFYLSFLQDVLTVGTRWQHYLMEGLRVAYSGVEGAFGHIAAMRIFPDGTKIPYPSFEDAYSAVEKGECDLAVLPIENSYAGEVGQVLDLMFSGNLHVNGVYDLPVTQNLLGLPGAKAEDIRTVISHPQALAQCQPYIRRHGYSTKSASNTAMAAKETAEGGDPSVGAIAGIETAQLYGLQLLDHDINESRLNTTRFAVFSRVEYPAAAGHDKGAFLILFTVKDEVGGLAKAINLISAYNFNMRVLRSRPMHDLPWNYYFYAELEGTDSSENGQRMLNALKGVCPMMKVVGRYTAAEVLSEAEKS